MDPSIMKLLEDDEDESMHSGAELEAFTAALNRDIGGDGPSEPPPSDPDTTGKLSQGSTSAAQQLVGQWQSSGHEENIVEITQNQEGKQLSRVPEQHPSHMGPILQGIGADDMDQQNESQPEHDQKQTQEEQPCSGQQLRPSETHSFQFIKNDQVKVPEQSSRWCPKQEKGIHSEIQQQHVLQDASTQQEPPSAVNQASDATRRLKSTTSAPTIPFQMLIPILRPHLDKDRLMQLQSVYAKLRKNEVSKEDFLRVIRNIVGDQMLRRAAHQVQMQVHAQATRNQQTNANQYSSQSQASSQQLSSHGAQQFSEPQAFTPLNPMSSSRNEKGHGSPPHQPNGPTSTMQTQTETSFTSLGSSGQKTQEVENKSDGKGLNVVQVPSAHMNAIKQERETTKSSFQAISKQQQNTQLPPTSFSMYGSTVSNLHPHAYPRPSITGTATSFKPPIQDSQMRQCSLNQGMGSTQLGTTQPMSIMNLPRYDQQNTANETKKVPGGTLAHLASHSQVQQNPIAWQPSANKEQRSNVFPSTGYVKQEVADMTSASQISGPVLMQVDQTMQRHPQISSATPPLPVTNTKAPPKKPSVGQKKSIEALGIHSPPASKKQKTSGNALDQSIEQLNDVTAVSGVDLREEEEQLLSAPKEENRASEATRRIVREEEERLILHKGLLQRKLRDIMFKCGMESMSSDVERCLSMCVEERLRGFLTNLIRLSKQRVDIEKTRHRSVITSDVRRQILVMNQKAKEEWDKKQADEAEKLRKLNQIEENTGAEADKEKEESRSKSTKVNKEEDDKMRTTAANVAARAAVGGDDMLSKWQLMAEQARQKREGVDGASSSQSNKTSSRKPVQSLGRTSREHQEPGNKGSSAVSLSGGVRKLGKGPLAAHHAKIARSISTKDVIVVLERDPQMSKSTLLYRLYERTSGNSAAE